MPCGPGCAADQRPFLASLTAPSLERRRAETNLKPAPAARPGDGLGITGARRHTPRACVPPLTQRGSTLLGAGTTDAYPGNPSVGGVSPWADLNGPVVLEARPPSPDRCGWWSPASGPKCGTWVLAASLEFFTFSVAGPATVKLACCPTSLRRVRIGS